MFDDRHAQWSLSRFSHQLAGTSSAQGTRISFSCDAKGLCCGPTLSSTSTLVAEPDGTIRAIVNSLVYLDGIPPPGALLHYRWHHRRGGNQGVAGLGHGWPGHPTSPRHRMRWERQMRRWLRETVEMGEVATVKVDPGMTHGASKILGAIGSGKTLGGTVGRASRTRQRGGVDQLATRTW